MPRLFDVSSNTCNTSCQHSRSINQTDPEETELLPASLIVALSFMCLMIVAVNGLVIFMIYKKKTLRTITNMFLTSLALSDLMSGLVGIPLLVICLVRGIIKVCVSSTVFIRFTAISSVCHVLLIACDRYIFIIHYMKYHALVTKRRAFVSIITAWLFSLIASLIQLSWYLHHEIAVTEYEDITEDHNKKYSLACIVLFFATPLLLMCYIYGRIFNISFKRNKSDRQLSKNLQQPSRSFLHEWRGRSVLLITVVIFAGCWLPYFLAMLDDYMEFSESSPMPVCVQRLLIFLAFFPPMLNPVLCTLAKKDFRRALKQVMLQWKLNNSFTDFKTHQEQIFLKPLPSNEIY
ncbi:LOW QUALITY PROTEIN: melanocyte-stimulating hormone receptor-like [Oculina patagonica]